MEQRPTTEPTDEDLAILRDLLFEYRNHGLDTFNRRLRDTIEVNLWTWLPPKGPYFNRAARIINVGFCDWHHRAVQRSVDGKRMPPPPDLRKLVALAVEKGNVDPDKFGPDAIRRLVRKQC